MASQTALKKTLRRKTQSRMPQVQPQRQCKTWRRSSLAKVPMQDLEEEFSGERTKNFPDRTSCRQRKSGADT